jgi:hypothetical protein
VSPTVSAAVVLGEGRTGRQAEEDWGDEFDLVQ